MNQNPNNPGQGGQQHQGGEHKGGQQQGGQHRWRAAAKVAASTRVAIPKGASSRAAVRSPASRRRIPASTAAVSTTSVVDAPSHRFRKAPPKGGASSFLQFERTRRGAKPTREPASL